MTFIPNVISKIDSNNSTTSTGGSSFIGSSTNTSGYNSIQINITSNNDSTPSGIIIQFSSDGITFTTFFSDTYLSTNTFIKKYSIQNNFYRIQYISSVLSNFTITTRLLTDSPDFDTSLNNFDNNIEYTVDSFGKLRVSNPFTLIDVKYPSLDGSTGTTGFRSNSLQISTNNSTGYTGDCQNSKCVITGVTGGYYASQTRNYCVYQPGKSLLILMSGIISTNSDTNYVARFGYFDNNIALSSPLSVKNGIYFEYTNNTIYTKISNDSVVVNSDTQSNWNIDKLNGTGTSGINLDFTKTQLFVIDLEWLGVGRVRFGFYIYGKIVYCHQITNINDLTSPYTTNINLPIGCSLHYPTSIAGPTGPCSITQICKTVISEGGYSPLGRPFSVVTPSNVGISTAETLIMMLRGGSSNYYHQQILPSGVTLISPSNTNIIRYNIRLYRDGNQPLTGSPSIVWTDVDTVYSVSQYSTSFTGTFTTNNSTLIDTGYFVSKGGPTFSDLTGLFTSQIIQITSNINNVSDILAITCSSASGSPDVYCSISWNEIY